jgi:hypothetical protein
MELSLAKRPENVPLALSFFSGVEEVEEDEEEDFLGFFSRLPLPPFFLLPGEGEGEGDVSTPAFFPALTKAEEPPAAAVLVLAISLTPDAEEEESAIRRSSFLMPCSHGRSSSAPLPRARAPPADRS